MPHDLNLPRSASAVLTALAASVAIAACGGSGSSSSQAASATGAGVKYAECIRAHGVPDYPDPGAGGEATPTRGGGRTRVPAGRAAVDGRLLAESSRVVDAAYGTCERYSGFARQPRYSDSQLARIQTGALAMSRCMRANGVPNYPDLTVGRGPGGHSVVTSLPGLAGIDVRSPAFKAANLKCSRLITVPGRRG